MDKSTGAWIVIGIAVIILLSLFAVLGTQGSWLVADLEREGNTLTLQGACLWPQQLRGKLHTYRKTADGEEYVVLNRRRGCPNGNTVWDVPRHEQEEFPDASYDVHFFWSNLRGTPPANAE